MDVEIEEKNLLEDAILSYLAQLSLNDATNQSHDPAGLTEAEQKIIRLRWEGQALKQIAERSNISISSVHRGEKEAIAKLRQWLFG